MTIDKLNTQITEFLKERKKSGPGGGWAPVSQKEMEEMYNIVGALIELKYEYDVDHDLPVTVKLLDRTMFQSSFYDNLYHDKAIEGHTALEISQLNLSRAVMNVGIAADQVRLAKIMLEEHLRKPK